MKEVKIGCHGLAGHQIHGSIPRLSRARLTAVSGVPRNVFDDLRSKTPEAFADAQHFPDLEGMLSRGDVDLVSLCSDYRAHQAGHAIQALKAGKHVLAEKPMATTWDDLESLREAAEASGRRLWTMTSMIYGPAFKGMKDVVQGGVIGTVVQIYAMKSYPYREARPQDRGVDGGLLMQAGIHAVSYVRYVTGLEFAEVFAQDTAKGNPKPGNLQMGGTMAFRMNDGSLCAIVCNYCNPPGIGFWGNDQLRVHGTEGMIELVDGQKRRLLAVRDREPTTFPDGEPGAAYPQDLVDGILDGTPTLLTQEDSFRNTEVVLRAQESADQGVVVKI